MTYDAKLPSQLKKTQQWFGQIISRPIDADSRMNPLSPSGQPMEVEAADYITPSPTLRPAQRIQLYNQQYWWRLLNIMQEGFPLVTRLFGFYDFNRTIAVPYLTKYPPRHWSLSLLGDRLSLWAKENYSANDKPLVINAIELDWAFNYSFIAPELPPFSSEPTSANDHSSLLKKKLYTQPHVHLFTFDSDMFEFRNEFLKHPPEYWIEHDFPELKHDKPLFYVLLRTPNNDISWKEISNVEYHLLHLFQSGSSIEKACDWLEHQEDALCNSAMENLHLWFQEWTIRKWLTTKTEKK
jgi:hypothetical protein